ncbi:tetratricopeptide repeat protein [Azonexus sp.]|uniref:tetratricopeptide repeat protein n=1 Tax=Azonexus sp. TaxID=1872668 RepID=UPI0027BB15FD|nr:tetratricopeptide repeat protein [Azonexus sp.]
MFKRSLASFVAVLSLTLAVVAQAADVDAELRQAARLHKNGDSTAAIAIWERWAGRGDIDAAYNLAVVNHHGDGVALDYAKALRWYRQAAEQGDKFAQVQIGLFYQNGLGVAPDETEAHRWFTMHRQHHFHHQHEPRMQAWRQQALALIEAGERREQADIARRDGAQVVAELRRRAGMPATDSALLAANTR